MKEDRESEKVNWKRRRNKKTEPGKVQGVASGSVEPSS